MSSLLWGHIWWWCSGLTHGSILRVDSWPCSEDRMWYWGFNWVSHKRGSCPTCYAIIPVLKDLSLSSTFFLRHGLSCFLFSPGWYADFRPLNWSHFTHRGGAGLFQWVISQSRGVAQLLKSLCYWWNRALSPAWVKCQGDCITPSNKCFRWMERSILVWRWSLAIRNHPRPFRNHPRHF